MSGSEGLARTAFGLCLRMAQIDEGDPEKFEGETDFLREVILDFIKSDPEGAAEIVREIRKEQKKRPGARIERTPVYKCAACEDRGWVRMRPNDPSSPRMTCKACSVRLGISL